jgi:dienelactone hydrolase
VLLDRERPHGDQRTHRNVHDVGGEEDGGERGRHGNSVQGEGQRDRREHRGQDAKRAARIEVSQRHAARALFRDQQRCNEKTGEHEEEIDAEIAADENLLVREVRDQHRQDGDGAKSVQLWNLFRHPLLCCLKWQNRRHSPPQGEAMNARTLPRLAFAFAVGAACGFAQAKVVTKSIAYEQGGQKLEGYLAYDDAKSGARPGVLVVPEWWGLNDYVKSRARQLAEMGYVAFAADMYGNAKVTRDPKQADEWSSAVGNGGLMAPRSKAALEVLKEQPQTDKSKLAAIGFCFGGSTVLQLAYSGEPLAATVTFHGGLMPPKEDQLSQIKVADPHPARRQGWVRDARDHRPGARLARQGEGRLVHGDLRQRRACLLESRCQQLQDPRHRLQREGGAPLLGRDAGLLQGAVQALEVGGLCAPHR